MADKAGRCRKGQAVLDDNPQGEDTSTEDQQMSARGGRPCCGQGDTTSTSVTRKEEEKSQGTQKEPLSDGQAALAMLARPQCWLLSRVATFASKW
jgi:hypothetical protein